MNFCQSQQKNMKCKLLGFALSSSSTPRHIALVQLQKSIPHFHFKFQKTVLRISVEEHTMMIILHNHHVMEMTIIFNSKVLEDDDELVEEEEADGGGAEEEGFHLLL